MATVPSGISVLVQYKHPDTFLYKPYFIGPRIGFGLC